MKFVRCPLPSPNIRKLMAFLEQAKEKIFKKDDIFHNFFCINFLAAFHVSMSSSDRLKAFWKATVVIKLYQ